MYKVFKNRGEGKTTDLIKKSAETQIPVLSFNRSSALYAKDLAYKMNLSVPEPMSLVPDAELRGKRTQVYLDDADCVIKTLFEDKFPGLELAGYAMSIND
jgi:hypothetical protein